MLIITSTTAMLILFLLLFYGVWRFRYDDGGEVDFDYRTIDPDIPVEPPAQKESSDTLEEYAEYAKQAVPLNPPPSLSAPPVPPPVQPAMNPPAAQSVAVSQSHHPIVEAPEALQQRADILDVENPIVQPTDQHVDVDIPERNVPSVTDHDSEYGVRYNSHSPGRMLRDKRYRRNAAND